MGFEKHNREESNAKKRRIRKIAKIMVEKELNGEIPQISKVMESVGYSRLTSLKKSGEVTKSDIYQKEMLKLEEELRGLQGIAIDIIKNKKDEASFRDGVDAMDKFTKLERLVSGKSTENVAHKIGSLLDSLESTESDTKNDENNGVE